MPWGISIICWTGGSQEDSPGGSGTEVGSNPLGGGDSGGGFGVVGGICIEDAEYGREVYFDATDSGPMSLSPVTVTR